MVTNGGKGVVAHVGARLLCELADELSLTEHLSAAMAPTKRRRRGHDRGEVLVDLAVALADGATTISDLRVLSDQPELFGAVASVPTAWRTLEAIDEEVLAQVGTARAEARKAAWAAGMDPGFYVIDIDGTLVDAHSEKEEATSTYKRGFGFYPLVAYLDATGEALAGLLRRGNAGSGTVLDHISVLEASLAQLPVDPVSHEVIVRTDSGGTTFGLAQAARERNVRFVGGVRMWAPTAQVVTTLEKNRWKKAISSDGTEELETGQVAEVTDLIDLSSWPVGTRMIARRELPHAGAQLRFTDVDGYRYQVFVTDLADPDIRYLEALYRGRGRVECAIRDAKDTGLANLPSHSFAINAAWLVVVLIAADLLAWMKGLCLEGELARAEPKRLRYTLLHAAGILVSSARRTSVRIAAGWPWADELVDAFGRLPSWATIT
jgi:hypothetical protein